MHIASRRARAPLSNGRRSLHAAAAANASGSASFEETDEFYFANVGVEVAATVAAGGAAAATADAPADETGQCRWMGG